MTINARASIAGVYEHPRREIPDRSIPQIHAEVAHGALADAGLEPGGRRCLSAATRRPGSGRSPWPSTSNLRPRYIDSTETGGSSYLVHVGHAADAIAAGRCQVALITMAGLARSRGEAPTARSSGSPEAGFESTWGMSAVTAYALAAQRHMYEFGTTSAQLAEVKVAASLHAQHNPRALLRTPVTVEEVLASPLISSPLHRLDCCVVTDGGGAVVVVSPEVARDLSRRTVAVLGHAEAVKHSEQRAHRSHVHRRRPDGTPGVCRGGGGAERRRLRLHL